MATKAVSKAGAGMQYGFSQALGATIKWNTLLCWLPILGGLVAGANGGRRSDNMVTALLVAGIVSAFSAIAIMVALQVLILIGILAIVTILLPILFPLGVSFLATLGLAGGTGLVTALISGGLWTLPMFLYFWAYVGIPMELGAIIGFFAG